MEDTEHEFKFAGVWIPPHVCDMLRDRQLKGPELILYSIVQALQGKSGCYASNKYLADVCGASSERRVQEHLSNLKKLGLVEQVHFDGRKRFLKVCHIDPPKMTQAGVRKNDTPAMRENRTPATSENRTHNKYKSNTNKINSLSDVPSDGDGFGVAKKKQTKVTTFDIEMATMLEAEVRSGKHKARETNIGRANPKAWANHIRRLRIQDDVSEEDIAKVMRWYVTNMGRQFVPEAYSGEAFRRKFAAIEKQALKDLKATVVPGKRAKAVMVRLNMLLWPKGSIEAVPSAVQSIMDDYGVWRSACAAFVKKLEDTETELEAVPEKKRRYWLGLGNKLLAFIPPIDTFAEQWMERVHKRVCGWEDWSGEFRSMLFDVESKQFRGIGTGLAEEWSGRAKDWDLFNEAMQAECS